MTASKRLWREFGHGVAGLAAGLLVAALLPVLAAPVYAASPGRSGLIVFIEDLPSGSGVQTTIRVIEPDGSGVRTVLGGAWQPTWSPDGRQIAFSDFPGGVTQAFVMNADGTGVRQITNLPQGAEHPAWSPDGTRLALVRYETAEMLTSIWTVRAADGGDARLVVPARDGSGRPTFAWEPAWGPDGRIAYSAVAWTGSAGEDAIFTVRADGSGAARVTAGTGASNPDWSPNGRWIAFERSHGTVPTTLHVVGADGTGERELVRVGGWPHDPVWSPDGTQVAFWTAEPGAGLYIVNADGSGLRLLRPGASAPSWQPLPAPASDPGSVTRLAGADRIETAVAVSRTSFPAAGSAGAVVLARADAFPDALAGSPLAVAEGGPLLLTATQQLDDRVRSEIQRVLAPGGTVYLLGGTAALSATVEDQTGGLGVPVQRLAGADRYATAVRITETLADADGPVFLATGANFPDALAAGAAAAHTGGVVLLTADRTMPAATANGVADHPGRQVYAVGGQAAAALPSATPLAGADRYATARLLAQAVFDAPAAVGVASGVNFPDGLSGGVHAGRVGAPLLLARPEALPAETASYLTLATSITRAYVYGGTAAVSTWTTSDIDRALTGR